MKISQNAFMLWQKRLKSKSNKIRLNQDYLKKAKTINQVDFHLESRTKRRDLRIKKDVADEINCYTLSNYLNFEFFKNNKIVDFLFLIYLLIIKVF